MHGSELTIVVLLCVSLALGAAALTLGKRLRVPHTVTMLLLGGVFSLVLPTVAPHLTPSHEGTRVVSDHLIIFVFLPVLVFESAFALDGHMLKKNLPAVLTLAVPALLVATGLTALAVVGLTTGSWGWGWLGALTFGALISATDPVAVVAVLRELGAPKRLSVLIEGESLLNDGAAIVVFGLLLELLVGGEFPGTGAALLHFAVVAGGGVVVGWGLARACAAWIRRTFNAPLVEITLTLVLAYGAMVVAEGLLHVSGVMAVVTAGVFMAGPGRVAISPEVQHFLHRFWEMLAFLANTLIFFLVGWTVAGQLEETTALDLGLAVAIYVAVMIIRALVVAGALPFVRRLGTAASTADGAVMAWGGLRGAVSLALALVIGAHPDIPAAFRRQVLVVTAVVVTLTIVINGTTIGALLRRFGLDRPPAAERLAGLTSRRWVLDQVADGMAAIQDARDLRTVDWAAVAGELDRDVAQLDERIGVTSDELAEAPEVERETGRWRRALRVERAALWNAFASGSLTARAVQILDAAVDAQLDRLAAGDASPPPRRLPAPEGSRLPGWLRRIVGMHPVPQALRHELLRGELLGAEAVLEAVGELDEQAEVVRVYRRYEQAAKEDLEELRNNLPEVTQQVETRLARRVRLELERAAVKRLAHEGALTPGEADEAEAEIEDRMKALQFVPIEDRLPETADLCRAAPLFADLDEAAWVELAEITLERAMAPGETLIEAGTAGDSMFVIARGAVGIYVDDDGEEPHLVEVLGGGDVVGEMALLTGEKRSATASAMTTVTVGEIRRPAFEALLERVPGLRDKMWRHLLRRRFDNYLRGRAGYQHLGRERRHAWWRSAEVVEYAAGDRVAVPPHVHAFVACGMVRAGGVVVEGPTLLPVGWQEEGEAQTETWVALLPPVLDALPPSVRAVDALAAE